MQAQGQKTGKSIDTPRHSALREADLFPLSESALIPRTAQLSIMVK
jgi:hypothetical protein